MHVFHIVISHTLVKIDTDGLLIAYPGFFVTPYFGSCRFCILRVMRVNEHHNLFHVGSCRFCMLRVMGVNEHHKLFHVGSYRFCIHLRTTALACVLNGQLGVCLYEP